jgi:hypothetical protein
MYKCHLCDLETKQLNGLMSRHYKIHCNDLYSKDQYKIDVLVHNGRQQKTCKVCNLPTQIPKGEAEYPDYHKECYVKNKLQGEDNPNYQNKLQEINCTHCNKVVEKYQSQTLGKAFCSTLCSTQFYHILENQSEAKKKAIEFNNDILRKLVYTEEFKTKRIAAMIKNGDMRSSRVEQDFYKHIHSMFPDAINGHQLDFYSVDIWIPSKQTAIDVQGNYWHNMDNVRSVDSRKAKFFINNRSDIKFYTIWESEIKNGFHEYERPYDITILCGPSGAGKSWIGEQVKDKYEIIDYDKISKMDKLLLQCQMVTNKHKLLITPIRATWIAKELRSLGLRVKIIGLIEDETTIEQRLQLRNSTITHGIKLRIKRYNSLKDRICMFYGNQQEVTDHLLHLN